MLKKYNSFIAVVVLGLVTHLLQAQTPQPSFELSATESGSKNYVARDYVTLKPGFTYTAATGNSFNAKIDQCLLFPPTANTYALPDGTITTDATKGAVVGAIPGQFAVSPTGAATYTIPIEVPAGINGMQPNISLVYNSQAGNGIAGWGWNLSAGSSIKRVKKDFFHDGVCSDIKYDLTDVIVLDGQRLALQSGQNLTIGAKYRTETESFSDVTYKSLGNHKGFEVKTKAGYTLLYGATEDSYCETVEGKEGCWLLSKSIDSNGNEINYIYDESVTTQQVYLKRITYGNSNSLSVDFEYEKRSEKFITYPNRFETLGNNKTLTKVITKSNNIINRVYGLQYEFDGIYTKLLHLTLSSGSDGNTISCNTLNVDWFDGQLYSIKNDWSVTSLAADHISNTEVAIFKDFNSDGTLDIMAYPFSGYLKLWYNRDVRKDGTPGFGYLQIDDTFRGAIPIDLNDDELLDIILIKDNGNNTYDYKFYCQYSQGNRYNFNITDIAITGSAKSNDIIVRDFNGDGKDEILLKSKGEVYNTKGQVIGITGSGLDSFLKTYDDSKFELIDYRGLGKTDFLIKGTSACLLYEFQDGKFKLSDIKTITEYQVGQVKYSEIKSSAELFTAKTKLQGDFNGDGKTDFFTIDENSNSHMVYACEQGLQNTTIENHFTLNNTSKLAVGDFNGDGVSDLVNYYTVPNGDCPLEYWREYDRIQFDIWIFDGEKFNLAVSYKECGLVSWVPETINTIQFGDVDGDGRTDAITLNNGYCSFEDKTSLTVKKIDNGMDVTTSMSYKKRYNTLTEKAPTTTVDPNSNLIPVNYTYPIIKSTKALNIVDEFKVTANNSIVENDKYYFSNPLLHRAGLGFLGFEKIQIIDNISNTIAEQHFQVNNLDYSLNLYYKGLFTNNGVLINSTRSDISFEKGGIKTSWAKTSLIRNEDKLTGLISLQKFSDYDIDGNPRTISFESGGESVETKTIKYISKGSWCLNKPESITTTKEDSKRVINYEYDTKGNLTKETRDVGDANQLTVEYPATEYDQFGNAKLKIETANGESHQTQYSYTPSGRFLQSVTNVELGKSVTYAYDENKGLLTSQKSDNLTTQYFYDGFGRTTNVIYPDKRQDVSTLQWAAKSGPTGAIYYSYTESSGNSPLIVWYDGLGRELQRDSYGLNGKMISVRTKYNEKGQISDVSDPFFEGKEVKYTSTYLYDDYGRPLTVTTAEGKTSYVYSGLTTTVTSPSGIAETVLDAQGRTASSKVNGKLVSYKYSYTSQGLITKATPEGGTEVTMEYNLQGNRTKLVDPDAGTIESKFNGFGQLKEESRPGNNNSTILTSYKYLNNGLLDYKLVNNDKIQYNYDDKKRLGSIVWQDNNTQTFTYDGYNRIIQKAEIIGKDEKNYVSKITYDNLGRISKQYYPSGYYTINEYDKYGYLISVKDSKGTIIWQAKEANEFGQLTTMMYGSNQLTREYDNRRLPTVIKSGSKIDMFYKFNEKGNLELRTDNISNQSESFVYDDLNRLTDWNITNSLGTKQNSVGYEAKLGNITSKSDIGYTMRYDQSHQLSAIEGNPALIPDEEQIVKYNNFNKVTSITEGNIAIEYAYGIDEERRKAVYKANNAITLTRYYGNSYEEEVLPNNSVRKLHYISGGNGLAAIFVQNQGKDSLYYTYCDYQGNLLAITDALGVVKQRYAYDPWGARRNPKDWRLADDRTKYIFTRGYTMHEHLDGVNLINMNGRVYDPQVGSFLSPDRDIQAPGNWLNYNRYSYCLGNPLIYSDPSGQNWFKDAMRGFRRGWDWTWWKLDQFAKYMDEIGAPPMQVSTTYNGDGQFNTKISVKGQTVYDSEAQIADPAVNVDRALNNLHYSNANLNSNFVAARDATFFRRNNNIKYSGGGDYEYNPEIGGSDALEVVSAYTGDELFGPIINWGMTFDSVNDNILNNHPEGAVVSLVEQFGGLYTVAAKCTYAISQTDYVLSNVGNLYRKDFDENYSLYLLTKNEFYLNKAIYWERQMISVKKRVIKKMKKYQD